MKSAGALTTAIRPPFGSRANAAMARVDLALAFRTLIVLSSTPLGCAAAWMTSHCPIPALVPGYRATPTCLIAGRKLLEHSSHLPAKLYSNWMKPVALPPGRACVTISRRRPDRDSARRRSAPCDSPVAAASPFGRCRPGSRRVERDQVCCVLAQPLGVSLRPAGVDPDVAADLPARLSAAPAGTPRSGCGVAVHRRHADAAQHADARARQERIAAAPPSRDEARRDRPAPPCKRGSRLERER